LELGVGAAMDVPRNPRVRPLGSTALALRDQPCPASAALDRRCLHSGSSLKAFRRPPPGAGRMWGCRSPPARAGALPSGGTSFEGASFRLGKRNCNRLLRSHRRLLAGAPLIGFDVCLRLVEAVRVQPRLRSIVRAGPKALLIDSAGLRLGKCSLRVGRIPLPPRSQWLLRVQAV
jgi:hypothetical protein